jgi:hypothetical protein
MQENQIHVTMLESIFTNEKAKSNFDAKGNPSVKIHTTSITRNQLEDLVFTIPDSVDINIKRSGTGMTIILTNK